jgi:ATP/maltotriose-dependent transcriptional regulator MalT
MVEARTSPPGQGTAPERQELLATKLTIPRIRPDSLVRPRLIEAIDEGTTRVLTLVSTPAGFGNSCSDGDGS